MPKHYSAHLDLIVILRSHPCHPSNNPFIHCHTLSIKPPGTCMFHNKTSMLTRAVDPVRVGRLPVRRHHTLHHHARLQITHLLIDQLPYSDRNHLPYSLRNTNTFPFNGITDNSRRPLINSTIPVHCTTLSIIPPYPSTLIVIKNSTVIPSTSRYRTTTHRGVELGERQPLLPELRREVLRCCSSRRRGACKVLLYPTFVS